MARALRCSALRLRYKLASWTDVAEFSGESWSLATSRALPLSSFSYAAQRPSCTDHRLGTRHWPRHCASVCRGRGFGIPDGADRGGVNSHREKKFPAVGDVQEILDRRSGALETDCSRIVAEARAEFGKIDILVNNAGHYGPVVPVEEYPLAEFDNVIAVHLRAAFLLSKLVLPEMYGRGSGVILNISSLSAKAAFPWGSAYAAAKAGMLGLTRITAAEAARKGVRVNAICPGPVTETRMSKELGNTLAAKLGVSPKDAVSRFSKHDFAGPRANRC